MEASIYRTQITHLRQAPVTHYFEHHSYSWYVDVDALPRLPRWLRAFARFDADDHFTGADGDSLRQRLDTFLAVHGATVPGGRITALLQARVLGYAFNPLSLYWCHDSGGTLRHVVAEVHNTRGERHAYLLPAADTPVMAAKRLYASPFHPVDGHYVVRAPRPEHRLDVSVALHRGSQPTFLATMAGTRRRATVLEVVRLQVTAPLAPLMVTLEMRVQGAVLALRRVQRLPWQPSSAAETDLPAAACPAKRPPGTDSAADKLPLNDPIPAGEQRPGRIVASGGVPRHRGVRHLLRPHAGAGVRIGGARGA